MTHAITHSMTQGHAGSSRPRATALQPMSSETREMRTQIASTLPTGVALSDAEIDAALESIMQIEGLPVEDFAAGRFAIDDEPDAIAVCPTAEELAQIAADAERDDLTPEEMAAHTRVLWNAIAFFQRRARDHAEASKADARLRLRLAQVRDDLRRQLGVVAA